MINTAQSCFVDDFQMVKLVIEKEEKEESNSNVLGSCLREGKLREKVSLIAYLREMLCPFL